MDQNAGDEVNWTEVEEIIASCSQPPPKPENIFRIMAVLANDAASGRASWEVRAIAKRLGRNEIGVGRGLRVLETLGYVCKIGRSWQLSADDKKWAPTHESYAEMIALYIVVKRPWLPITVEFKLGEVAHGLRRLRRRLRGQEEDDA